MPAREFKKEDANQASNVICSSVNVNQSLTEEAVLKIKKNAQASELIKNSKKINYFVYEKNKKILGIGALDNGEIKTMYVLQEQRGKGIGSEIIESIIKKAKSLGIMKLFLYTHPDAEKFYLSNKFSTTKKFKDSSMNVVYMEGNL